MIIFVIRQKERKNRLSNLIFLYTNPASKRFMFNTWFLIITNSQWKTIESLWECEEESRYLFFALHIHLHWLQTSAEILRIIFIDERNQKNIPSFCLHTEDRQGEKHFCSVVSYSIYIRTQGTVIYCFASFQAIKIVGI